MNITLSTGKHFLGGHINIAVSFMVKTLMLGLVLHWTMAVAEENTSASPGDFLKRLGNSHTLSGALFEPNNRWDTGYHAWQTWKGTHHLPISIGAYNWLHVNNDGPTPSGYGIPGLRGTYFWYVDADPHVSLDGGVIQSVGVHAEFRFRDTADKFRPFFDHTYWFYEAYGYADTRIGRIKAGRIWKRFGLDWDDTWWGDVQYFDGFKLAPDDGFSWENTWHPAATFKLDSFVQYFVAPSNISGSLVGANPQSVTGSSERNVGVIRIVPTWQLTDDASLALGISTLAGEIKNTAARGNNTNQLAWAADITYKWNGFKVFGEVDQSFGVLNRKRYVSGGPSNRITDLLAGMAYRYGPVTYRFAWSAGFDANPSGHQYLWVPGVTIAMTKNINLYAEYVRWDVTDRTGKRTTFEDGFQLVLNWHI